MQSQDEVSSAMAKCELTKANARVLRRPLQAGGTRDRELFLGINATVLTRYELIP